MPAGGEAELVRDLDAFAADAGLSVNGSASVPTPAEPWHVNDVMLLSPHATVMLLIKIDTRRSNVPFRAVRTCLDDSPLDAWQPYWSRFVAFLRAHNYVVRPVRRPNPS